MARMSSISSIVVAAAFIILHKSIKLTPLLRRLLHENCSYPFCNGSNQFTNSPKQTENKKIYTIFGIRRIILLIAKIKFLSDQSWLATCIRRSARATIVILQLHLIKHSVRWPTVSTVNYSHVRIYIQFIIYLVTDTSPPHQLTTTCGSDATLSEFPNFQPLEAKSSINDSVGKCQLIIIICECRVTDKCARSYRKSKPSKLKTTETKRKEKEKKKTKNSVRRTDEMRSRQNTLLQ